MSKRKQPPKILWALFDAQGEFFSTYDSREAADQDAVGPRFRRAGKDAHKIRAYRLLLRREEP